MDSLSSIIIYIYKIFISMTLYVAQLATPLVGIIIVVAIFSSLFKSLSRRRVLITLYDHTNKSYIPITYWENSIGRSKHCDIVVKSQAASRDHAVLYRREEGWFIADTNSKGGVFLNGKQITDQKKVCINDVIKIGGMKFTLCKADAIESQEKEQPALSSGTYHPLFLMILVMIFHGLATFQACFNGGEFNFNHVITFVAVEGIFWFYYIISRFVLRRANFELEILAFFLSVIGIVTSSSINISMSYTQIAAFAGGLALFSVIIIFIKDPDFATKCRPYIAAFAILALLINLVFGKVKNGSQNWVMIGSLSIQPSEFVKIAFVFFGASTLRKLQTTKNLTEFILFSCLCMGALFMMGDFGTACIFFVAFVVISFMRSGSIRTVFLTLASSVIGATLILKFKPYILNRFSAWRHVWEHTADTGYQQSRVLAYAASGGLVGMGIGRGCLKYVFAAPSDLVFGMLCEEWGIILGFTVVISIAMIAVYARLVSARSRSAFYSIAAIGAAGIMIFQMMMNVFGSTDLLPLTGVTMPFVSLGGSSLVSMWGLLAFIKAADERTYGLKK